MAIRIDPENNEINDLLELGDLDGQDVLEIGCGDGRLTRRYAGKVTHVTAVDPWVEGIARAKKDQPVELHDRVEFQNMPFLDFASETDSASFDRAILAWSL